MQKSTALERAYARWQVEKNPGALLAGLQGMARIVGRMNPRLRELLQEEIAKEQIAAGDGGPVVDDGQPEQTAAGDRAAAPKAYKGTVNARMLEAVQTDLDTVGGWTCRQWAEHLKCGKSTVVETPTWTDLAIARERVKLDHAKSHRRKPKASTHRRD